MTVGWEGARQAATLALLSRTLHRETHVLAREPANLASHLHNMVLLDEADEDVRGPLLARARDALSGRLWLRLVNRPPGGEARSALVRILEGHVKAVTTLALSEAGFSLASASDDHTMRLWDVVSGQEHGVFKVQPSAESARVSGLAWSPDASAIALGYVDGRIELRDAISGAVRRLREGRFPTWDAHLPAWSPDGSLLASAGVRDPSVRIWEISTGRLLSVLRADHSGISVLAWSPDGSLLAGAGPTGLIWIWDPKAGTEESVLRGDRLAWALTWSPDGSMLASADGALGAGGTVRLWDRSHTWRSRVISRSSVIWDALVWRPDGLLLGAERGGSRVRVWEFEGNELVGVLAQGCTLRCLAWSADGQRLASGGVDGSIRLWDPTRAGRPSEVKGHGGPAVSAAFSPDCRILASGAEDNMVRLWNPTGAEPLGVLETRAGAVTSLAWSPDGSNLAVGGFDASVQLWDPIRRRRESVATVKGWLPVGDSIAEPSEHSSGESVSGMWPVSGLAWSPDGQYLAIATGDKVVLLDMPSGRPAMVLAADTSGVRCLAWSVDGRRLASGSWEATILVWERNESSGPTMLEGHEGAVTSLAWSPREALLASGSLDGTLRVWDLGGTSHSVIQCPTEEVKALAWTRDGTLLASATAEGDVIVWQARTWERLTSVRCLSSVRAMAFGDDGAVLRVADSGAATGNRPLAYEFDVCNVDFVWAKPTPVAGRGNG